MVTDAELNAYARSLAANLSGLLDVLDAAEFGEVPRRIGGDPLCRNSHLDFMTHNGVPISPKTSRRAVQRQLDLCEVCSHREPCLEVAVSEKRLYGIWGGKLPGEITAMVRERRLADVC